MFSVPALPSVIGDRASKSSYIDDFLLNYIQNKAIVRSYKLPALA